MMMSSNAKLLLLLFFDKLPHPSPTIINHHVCALCYLYFLWCTHMERKQRQLHLSSKKYFENPPLFLLVD